VIGHVVAYDYTPSASGVQRLTLISDAPIWLGNSGGLLFDDRGEITGIASQIVRFDGPDGMFRLFAVYVPIESILVFMRQIRGAM